MSRVTIRSSTGTTHTIHVEYIVTNGHVRMFVADVSRSNTCPRGNEMGGHNTGGTGTHKTNVASEYLLWRGHHQQSLDSLRTYSPPPALRTKDLGCVGKSWLEDRKTDVLLLIRSSRELVVERGRRRVIGWGEQHRQRWASASINPITLITHDSRIYHKTHRA